MRFFAQKISASTALSAIRAGTVVTALAVMPTVLSGSASAQTYPTAAAATPAPETAAVTDPSQKPKPIRASFTLKAGAGQVLHLEGAATNVFTADPKVAEVRPASPTSLFVFGVAPGVTTVAAMSAAGDTVAQYQITVLPSGFVGSQARSAVGKSQTRSSIRVTPTEGGVELNGTAATPGDADRLVNAAKGAMAADAKIQNDVRVAEPIQVSLHVRIAEMSRKLTRELGVNWQTAGRLGTEAAFGVATNNVLADNSISPSQAAFRLGNLAKRGWDLTAIVDALSQDQLVHVLAEPNLTTMSGEPASFLVGGEFPIPVATNNNTISLEFKQYGISLAFVPTVVSHNRISLHVRPEVSQLDKANGVTSIVNSSTSISIPALTVRRADTTVELGSGQSFAIAGLLSDQTTLTGLGVPGLGDLPVLGALFRSDSFQRQETELVIVVTPYIVRPISDPNALHLPTDGWRAPNDLERILELRQMAHGSTTARRRIPADAGFMVE